MNALNKTLCLVVAVMTMATTASAQYRFGGMMMDRDGMMADDMFTLSQVNFGFGSARSMAMAGAFTSLGADVASMGINPAGLGMYRSSDVSFTPMMSFNNASHNVRSVGENSQSRFSMSNFALSLNLYESSRTSLVSLNIGFGYNRVADFNYNYSFSSQSAPSADPMNGQPYRSILDAFTAQLGVANGGQGLFPTADGLICTPANSYFWGGILAYNNYLIDDFEDEFGPYWTTAERLGANASVGHLGELESRGSIGEYDFSLGLNVDNKLYFGATLGLQVVDWTRQFFYGEDYIYNGSAALDSAGYPLATPASWMDYNQAVKVEGTGVNLKLGMIYRPVESLRLGVALHTPTYYSLERRYQAFMSSNFEPEGFVTDALDDTAENSWDFCSPTRLMFGASYSFGRFAIISVDYERDWYNGIRVKNIPIGFDLSKDDYKYEIKQNYKGSNTLRVGAELKPLPMLALRAGYGISGDALREDKSLYYNSPINYRTTCFSLGLGMAFGRLTVDLAYQNIKNFQTEYMLYYAENSMTSSYHGLFDTASPMYRTDLTRNYAILSLGYKF